MNILTETQQANLKIYKSLSKDQKQKISTTIDTLKDRPVAPTMNNMKRHLEATGHLDVAMDCYAAELLGIAWRN